MFKKDEELIEDEHKFQQNLPGIKQVMATMFSAIVHMGLINGTYPTPTVLLGRSKIGARRTIQLCLKVAEWLPESGFEGSLQFYAFSLNSLSYVRPTELAAAKQVLLGEGGALVALWFATYELEWHAAAIAQNQDGWHGKSGRAYALCGTLISPLN